MQRELPPGTELVFGPLVEVPIPGPMFGGTGALAEERAKRAAIVELVNLANDIPLARVRTMIDLAKAYTSMTSETELRVYGRRAGDGSDVKDDEADRRGSVSSPGGDRSETAGAADEAAPVATRRAEAHGCGRRSPVAV